MSYSFNMPATSTRMSFTRSTPRNSSVSMYAGVGGPRISSTSSSSVRSGVPISSSTSFKVRSGMGGGLGAGMGGGSMAGGADSSILGNEKGHMQNLNDRLANYMAKVKTLEQANGELEMKIREALEKGGAEVRDYSKYDPIIEDLRKQIFDKIVDNARLVLQIDNARLASDDFEVKLNNEAAIRQSVEADIAGLKKLIDDTNMSRVNIENEIQALQEELGYLKRNHEDEVMELRNQIAQSGVQVDVNAPKGQDLSMTMEDIRNKYEKEALKNAEDLKRWHENQISDVQVQVAQNTEALQGAQMEKGDLGRQLQNLEIELMSQNSLKASLEQTLRDTETRNNMEMEKYNDIILHLQNELAKLRENIKEQNQDYETLLSMKMKLEQEIMTYKNLLDGGEGNRFDNAVDALVAMN